MSDLATKRDFPAQRTREDIKRRAEEIICLAEKNHPLLDRMGQPADRTDAKEVVEYCLWGVRDLDAADQAIRDTIARQDEYQASPDWVDYIGYGKGHMMGGIINAARDRYYTLTGRRMPMTVMRDWQSQLPLSITGPVNDLLEEKAS